MTRSRAACTQARRLELAGCARDGLVRTVLAGVGDGVVGLSGDSSVCLLQLAARVANEVVLVVVGCIITSSQWICERGHGGQWCPGDAA